MGCVFVCLFVFWVVASSVVQQASTVRTHSDLRVGEYIESAASWAEDTWMEEMKENQV